MPAVGARKKFAAKYVDRRRTLPAKLINITQTAINILAKTFVEKNRFRLLGDYADFALHNNYERVFIDRINLSISEEDNYGRRLFLELVTRYMEAHQGNLNYRSVLDYGGGFGQQALYLGNHYDLKKIDVLERKALVEKVNSLAEVKDRLLEKNIRFIDTLPSYQPDCIMFNGSISYLDGSLQDLLNRFSGLIAISRLPVSSDIHEDITVHDSFGNHYERIFSYKKLMNFLNTKKIYYMGNSEPLVESKRQIGNIKLRSIEVIFQEK